MSESPATVELTIETPETRLMSLPEPDARKPVGTALRRAGSRWLART